MKDCNAIEDLEKLTDTELRTLRRDVMRDLGNLQIAKSMEEIKAVNGLLVAAIRRHGDIIRELIRRRGKK